MTVPETYRVIGCNGRRERVVASGLTQQDARAMKDRMKADPLCRGFCISIEAENPAADAIIAHMRTLHTR